MLNQIVISDLQRCYIKVKLYKIPYFASRPIQLPYFYVNKGGWGIMVTKQ